MVGTQLFAFYCGSCGVRDYLAHHYLGNHVLRDDLPFGLPREDGVDLRAIHDDGLRHLVRGILWSLLD